MRPAASDSAEARAVDLAAAVGAERPTGPTS